jgi:hypothetical protein
MHGDINLDGADDSDDEEEVAFADSDNDDDDDTESNEEGTPNNSNVIWTISTLSLE